MSFKVSQLNRAPLLAKVLRMAQEFWNSSRPTNNPSSATILVVCVGWDELVNVYL